MVSKNICTSIQCTEIKFITYLHELFNHMFEQKLV